MQWQYTGNVTSFSSGDKALTKNFYEFKKCSLQRIQAKFLKINRNREGLGHVTKKIWTTESAEQRHESGRLKHARTEENVTTVDELVALLNHEGQKQTHSRTRQISTKTGLIQRSTVQIIRRDFGLKCLSSSNTPVA